MKSPKIIYLIWEWMRMSNDLKISLSEMKAAYANITGRRDTVINLNGLITSKSNLEMMIAYLEHENGAVDTDIITFKKRESGKA